MATGNFYKENASNYYTMNPKEEHEFEWLIEDMRSLFNNRLNSFEELDEWEHGNSSYAGKYIGKTTASKNFGDCEAYIEISIMYRNGYYSGINFDWDSSLYLFGEECSNLEHLDNQEVEEALEFESEMNTGMMKIQAKNIMNWITKTHSSFVEQIEEILKQNTNPLAVVARFSNGEVWYSNI